MSLDLDGQAPDRPLPNTPVPAPLKTPPGGPLRPPLRTPSPAKSQRRRSTLRLPAAVRKEITKAARELNRQCRKLFMADPKLKDRAARLLRSMLLPKRKRGRPGMDSVTLAIALRSKYRRDHPSDKPRQIWERIYPQVIPQYRAMSAVQQRDAREQLTARVTDRLKKRKRRAPSLRQGN
jgi:hypothetical protein